MKVHGIEDSLLHADHGARTGRRTTDRRELGLRTLLGALRPSDWSSRALALPAPAERAQDPEPVTKSGSAPGSGVASAVDPVTSTSRKPVLS